MGPMKIIIESPYAGDLVRNVGYARECLWDSLSRQESPFASHLLYTQVLDDKIPAQRETGLKLAIPWYDAADLCAVYTDLGISDGMKRGMAYARSISLPVEERRIRNGSQTSFGASFRFSQW
jgi:hypothetical protein